MKGSKRINLNDFSDPLGISPSAIIWSKFKFPMTFPSVSAALCVYDGGEPSKYYLLNINKLASSLC